MDTRGKRKLRLLELIEIEGGRGRGKGGLKKVAEKAETDPNYLSQVLSDKIKSNMGDRIARRLEIAYGKPVGWMDRYYSDNFVDEMLWVYEHAPEEAKRFIEFTVEAVRTRYL